MSVELSFRSALPSDLDEAVAIDDDACVLFARAGFDVDLAASHPYTVAERSRWLAAMESGNAYLASLPRGPAVGLLVLGRVNGQPYLDQLSVRQMAMRQGIGTELVRFAVLLASGRPLWLTTYDHLPWNAPFYERCGFRVVAEASCPPELREHLAVQRRHLPAPEHRVAMCRET